MARYGIFMRHFAAVARLFSLGGTLSFPAAAALTAQSIISPSAFFVRAGMRRLPSMWTSFPAGVSIQKPLCSLSLPSMICRHRPHTGLLSIAGASLHLGQSATEPVLGVDAIGALGFSETSWVVIDFWSLVR